MATESWAKPYHHRLCYRSSDYSDNNFHDCAGGLWLEHFTWILLLMRTAIDWFGRWHDLKAHGTACMNHAITPFPTRDDVWTLGLPFGTGRSRYECLKEGRLNHMRTTWHEWCKYEISPREGIQFRSEQLLFQGKTGFSTNLHSFNNHHHVDIFDFLLLWVSASPNFAMGNHRFPAWQVATNSLWFPILRGWFSKHKKKQWMPNISSSMLLS